MKEEAAHWWIRPISTPMELWTGDVKTAAYTIWRYPHGSDIEKALVELQVFDATPYSSSAQVGSVATSYISSEA